LGTSLAGLRRRPGLDDAETGDDQFPPGMNENVMLAKV
jgi:hypothetical protein